MTTTPLAAGPALDHLIATRVLGWNYDYQLQAWAASGGTVYDIQPAYSTDLGAAAAVLDWLGERGHVVIAGETGAWDCQIDMGRAFIVKRGDTPAEAICRLALAIKENAG